MPNRDDEEWDELEISFRIDHCQDKYFEHLMKSFFNTEVSVEYDPEQRGGFTGFFYKVRATNLLSITKETALFLNLKSSRN